MDTLNSKGPFCLSYLGRSERGLGGGEGGEGGGGRERERGRMCVAEVSPG